MNAKTYIVVGVALIFIDTTIWIYGDKLAGAL